MSRHHDLELAIAAALRGAAVVRESFGRAHTTERRQVDSGVVTEVDRHAEAAILELLRHDSPYGVLAEESGELPGSDPSARWVVNPIDGTANFARGIPLFCVSIALLRGLDVEVGVIVDPVREDCLSAVRGGGATLGESTPVAVRTEVIDPIVLFESGYSSDDERAVVEVAGTLSRSFDTRRLGSTAYELGLIARGAADGFVSRGDHLWDVAAGIVLIQEAGGAVTDWSGVPWVVGTPELAASTPALHGALLSALQAR